MRVPCPSGPRHPRGAKTVSCFLYLQNLETGKTASLCLYGRLNAGQLLKAMHTAENAFPNITHRSIKPYSLHLEFDLKNRQRNKRTPEVK